MQILRDIKKSKKTARENKSIGVSFSTNTKLLPNTLLVGNIDQYEQYVKEKEASDIYRFFFTINPLCSNCLFNSVTEIVKDEGSDNTVFFGKDGMSGTLSDPNNSISSYLTYKGCSSSYLNRQDMIRDTAFSHKDIGGIVYHCGFDIFNNHVLRRREFAVISRLKDDSSNSGEQNFNTLSDFIRDRYGEKVQEYLIHVKTTGGTETMDKDLHNIHEYTVDNTYTFSQSIDNNLIEKDGWFGFSNITTLDISNYKEGISLNKCMNNNKATEFIDMYPDRSLYSFIPKYNKYRNRIEKNWEYCLTYPYRNAYNPIVEEIETGVNGIKAYIMDEIQPLNNDFAGTIDLNEGKSITFRTDIKHNLKLNNMLSMSLITNNQNVIEVANEIVVSSVLDDYHFQVHYDAISDYLPVLTMNLQEIRIRKRVDGIDSQYYIRVFKKIPNFKNTEVYDDGLVTDDEIDTYCDKGFNSSVNKVAFSRNIYNDFVSQINFNDDIKITGLRNNLGQPLTEVFLTLVKNNKGYKKWYGDTPVYSGDDIEFSHCFGKLTAGLDLPIESYAYNVHRIHNVSALDTVTDDMFTTYMNIPRSVADMEEHLGEITIDGDSVLGNGEFYGDIVEFVPTLLTETVLEDIYFRFNTAQREYCKFTTNSSFSYVNGEYANIITDDVIYDDYDFEHLFEVSSTTFNEIYEVSMSGERTVSKTTPVNIFPEGYYYKAHNRVGIREYSDTIQQGNHIRMTFNNASVENGVANVELTKNYYCNVNDIVYIYDKDTLHKVGEVYIDSVDKRTFRFITFNVPSVVTDLNNFILYRHNPAKPAYAYELDDGTGRYIWRDIKKEVEYGNDSPIYNSIFTNGAHYFHNNINFYLRRQDPNGFFGLSYTDGVPSHLLQLTIGGEYKDITRYDFSETKHISC